MQETKKLRGNYLLWEKEFKNNSSAIGKKSTQDRNESTSLYEAEINENVPGFSQCNVGSAF